MKITIYELLGMIKNGKAPKRFKYDSCVWTYNYESFAYRNGKNIKFEDYMDNGIMKYLNDEVEIIEEKNIIPENLPFKNDMKLTIMEVYRELEKYNYKINEIIDYLKSKGE